MPLATILTMVQVDPADPAFDDPTKFVGPIYTQAEADALSAAKGWVFKPDGDSWRRVVPSPEPRHIFEIRPIRWLLDHGVVLICAGGGGVPTMFLPDAETTLVGVEAVIDKDLASELLAREVAADLFVMATDVDAVYADWGTPQQRALGRVTVDELRAADLPGRLDGTEGRGGLPLRRGDRRARRDRLAHADPADRRRRRGHPGGGRVNRRSPERRRHDAFGVHSEVGRLRKVMVHRPELSLQRLTPTNHDDLLFDDVLWVERAQYEHDQFVAKMRERGVEVFLLQDLLGEALAASDEGRRKLIELAASEFTVGISLVDEVRSVLWGMTPGDARPTSSAV